MNQKFLSQEKSEKKKERKQSKCCRKGRRERSEREKKRRGVSDKVVDVGQRVIMTRPR